MNVILQMYVQWAVFVPTAEMFLPELGGRGLVSSGMHLKAGSGVWGDMGVFDPMYVDSHSVDAGSDSEEFAIKKSSSSIICTMTPLDRPRCFHGFIKSTLEEVFFFAFPLLLPYSESITEIFGRVKDRNNFQQMLNTDVSLRELLTTLILHATGPVLDKLNLLFDLYAHQEPEKLALQEQAGETEFLTSNALYYCPQPFADTMSPMSYKQIAMLQRVERCACASEPFMPRDAQTEIVKDSRIRNNAISLRACVALTQQILSRSGIHLNTMDAIFYACTIFDVSTPLQAPLMSPYVLTACTCTTAFVVALRVIFLSSIRAFVQPACRIPRVVSAMLTLTEIIPSSARDGPKKPQNVDVTSAVIDWVKRSTAETSWYGLNFFRSFSLEMMEVHDFFPGRTKKLTIILTPTGDLCELHAVTVELDGEGMNRHCHVILFTHSRTPPA